MCIRAFQGRTQPPPHPAARIRTTAPANPGEFSSKSQPGSSLGDTAHLNASSIKRLEPKLLLNAHFCDEADALRSQMQGGGRQERPLRPSPLLCSCACAAAGPYSDPVLSLAILPGLKEKQHVRPRQGLSSSSPPPLHSPPKVGRERRGRHLRLLRRLPRISHPWSQLWFLIGHVSASAVRIPPMIEQDSLSAASPSKKRGAVFQQQSPPPLLPLLGKWKRLSHHPRKRDPPPR
mmetsp:Transcript_22955/g.36971  ORF Transcript_22955/g.36971 Transcript_22955/m.36971 type:complete len:234 (-) Transcript_22955:141-842(-)